MDNTKLKDKISDIIKWSTQAFTDEILEDSLNNSRKAGEAICKAIIFKHYGEIQGENIVLGKEKIDGTPNTKPKELDFSSLINIIIKENDINYTIITHKRTRHKIKAYLEIIRTHSNPGSHDPNDPKDIIKSMDVKITRITLSILLYWLFFEYLNKDIPCELISHINFNLDIVIEKVPTIQVKETAHQIIEKIKKLELIDEEMIKKFQSTLNLLLIKLDMVDNKEIELLFGALKKYNKLPRKLGHADVLNKFLEENSVLEKMKNILKKLGVRL